MKEKILIVDDEMDLLDLVDFNLTRKGYKTEGALDGVTALDKARAFSPEVIVLDLMLPGIDGWELCRRFKEMGNDTAVIMLTAKSLPEDKVKGLESGADDYITKPFDVKELVIRIEKLLEKKRMKELQSLLVHEIANSLSVIGGCSKLLAMKDSSKGREDRDRHLMNINRQVGFATELVSDAGAFLAVERDGLSLAKERCDLTKIVARMVESYRRASSEIEIRMPYEIGATEVDASPFALKHVFGNILWNAVKYGRPGGRIDVGIHDRADGVAVRIKDDGIGIPAVELPRIFDRGYRAANAPKDVYGTGLGLYLVKRFLEKMGACITVESEVGKGSEFIVFFPKNTIHDGLEMRTEPRSDTNVLI